MHFIVKQRIISIGKQYKVFDESESQVYEISSQLFSPERRKEVLDMSGNAVAWSEWPMLSGRAELNAGGVHCSLDIPFVSIVPRWTGDCGGSQLSVSGDFLKLSFTVDKAGETAATVEKRIIAFTDTYVVDVDEAKLPPAFALLITALIDHKYHSEEGR